MSPRSEFAINILVCVFDGSVKKNAFLTRVLSSFHSTVVHLATSILLHEIESFFFTN